MNVAVGLGRLGHTVALHTSIASDANGSAILRHLVGSGVDLHNVNPPPYTSSAIATIQEDGSARYEFDITWDLPPVQVSRSARFVHTGSLGAVLAPGAANALTALRTARAHAITTFDPNVRPDLMRPHTQQLALTEEFFGAADVVKLSDEDAAWLYPTWTLDQVVDRLLELGAVVVAVTRGADGAILAAGEHRVSLATHVSNVVDTIGAGDSFMAGMIYAIDDTIRDADQGLVDRAHLLDLSELARVGTFAQSCAAITVSRRGADLPWADEVGRGSLARS